jgi:hypothetical protein
MKTRKAAVKILLAIAEDKNSSIPAETRIKAASLILDHSVAMIDRRAFKRRSR